MKNKFRKAHEMAKEIKREYPEVDYKTQFGLCLSYLLNNKEESKMTMEKWFEGLSEKEKSSIVDGAEARTGYLRPGETAEEWKVRKKENFDNIVKEKYQRYLRDVEWQKEREESNKQEQLEREKQRKRDLARGIAIIELYQSNRYRCWVAEVTGTDDKFGLERRFINPVEIKGNYRTYELKEGKYYNYLNNNKQHFVKVVNAELIELTRSEMMEAIK